MLLEWKPDMVKILIVSDNPEFRSATRFAFANAGFFLIQARDGLAALQHAVEDAPAMIVLDESLGGIEASAIRDRLAAEIQTVSIPVRIVSHQALLERATQTEPAMTSSPPAMLSVSG